MNSPERQGYSDIAKVMSKLGISGDWVQARRKLST